jgi:hypothetical protein
MSGTIISTRERWLIDADAMVPGQWLKVPSRGDLGWPEGQKALDAQYGTGAFSASTHGNTFQVRRNIARSALNHGGGSGR